MLYDNVNDDENRLRIMNYDKTREACTMTLTITITYIIYYLTIYKLPFRRVINDDVNDDDNWQRGCGFYGL